MSAPEDERAALEALLRGRARALAERALERAQPEVFARVIAVRRGRASWGLPRASVEEVRRVRTLAVPGARGQATALFALRGRLHGLVDPQALAGAPEDARGAADAEPLALLLVAADGRTLGLRVDEVFGDRAVLRDEVDGSQGARRLGFVAAVTADCLELIDVAALFEECARPRRGS